MSLVSYKTIEGNLRRTASNGLISLLNQRQFEELAYKYFSDEDGNYTCPYTGKVISGNEIVLEHIIPVYSNGGTVLFNCVPASKEANGSNEKGAKHLIDWWANSEYWNPNRLKNLVDYMLEGYELVFREYTVEEVESSYLDVELDEKEVLEDDSTIRETIEEEKELLKQARNSKIDSYLGFMLDCVRTLENYGIDTQEIANRLYDLQKRCIFEDIEKYQLYQNKIQGLIKNIIGDENTAYLSYSTNIDIKKLISSIDKEYPEEVLKEIELRIKYIEQLLKDNGLSIIDYFKSLRDIVDIDILYKDINSLTKKDVNVFLENIKVGIDTKISIFIKMLNKGNSKILATRTKETLEGYPSIGLSQFWNNRKDKIKEKLFEELKDNQEYDVARKIVDVFEMETSVDKKIPIFIEMLNKGNSEILKSGNQETLEGYPSISLSQFWNKHKDKIKEKLFVELKENQEYELARQLVDTYETKNNFDKRISIFIEMLNKGNSDILKQGNQETLEGYPSIRLTNFFDRYKEKIKEKLFVELKDNPEYDVARKIVDVYEMEISVDKKIPIFIDMLNKGNSEIMRKGNQETLEGYPSISLSRFWSNYKDKIKEKLFEELKENPEYDVARKIVDVFEMETSVDKKISIFIDMLNKGNAKVLKFGNQETLEGYPSIGLSQFWNNRKDKIKEKLFEELKENQEYETARQIVLKYFKVNSYEELNASLEENSSKRKVSIEIPIEEKIRIFIEMLNKGNSEILKRGNQETLEGYPSIGLSHFWSKHKDKIKEKLFEELKENPEYDVARQIVDVFEMEISVDKKITIFIEMLNKGNAKVLKNRNQETLEGYPSIGLSQFWNKYKDKIKEKLFKELKENPEYDVARQIVDVHEMETSVDKKILIFIDMLNKGNSEIMRQGNQETLEGYPSISLSCFWNSYKDKIKEKLFEELKDNPEYDVARQLIDVYEMEFSVDKKIPIFIDMLNKGNSEILKTINQETLEGYPSISLSRFWQSNKEKIKEKLFYELKDNPEYELARQTVLSYFKVGSLEELEEKVKLKKKQLKEVKKVKKGLEGAIIDFDKVREERSRRRVGA